MKRTLLLIIALTSFGALNAQIEIQQDGTGPDLSGTILEFNVDQFDSAEYQVQLYVTNNTGSNQQWRITRVEQSVPPTWTDQVCWPPQCYNPDSVVYTTPSSPGTPAPTVVNGSDTTTLSHDAILKPIIVPGSTNGVALYMYYITDNNGNYVDSVGLRYNFVLGVDETTPNLSVTVAPNPANSYIKIKTNNVESATVKMLDVLGNIVLKETVLWKSKSINTESFRNGIYFVVVEAEGAQRITRKVIVRH